MSGQSLTAAVARGEFGRISSVLISRGGELVYEEYFDGGRDDLRNTRSCTKTVAGMLVGIAIDEGFLAGVDVRVLELLARADPFPNPDRRKSEIRIEDLLTMSSCLECDDTNPSSAGNEERMYPVEDWVGFALGLPVRERRSFSYCTAGVVVLGVALAYAVGQPLEEFAQRSLFGRLGIERATWQLTPLGDASTAGGLLLTSRDLLALGRLYLAGGRRDGRQIVSADWVAASTRPHIRVDDATGYGYLWWLKSFAGHLSYFMSGTGGNRVHVVPALDLVAVITTTSFGRRDAHELSDRLVAEHILNLG